MTTKKKILIISLSVLVGIGLLVGSFCLGRYTKYNGTARIGEEAKSNAEQVSTDIDLSKNLLSTSISLLDPTLQSNIIMYQTIDSLQKSNEATTKCLDDFVELFETTQKNINNFSASYQADKNSEDYAWDLMIKEAEQLEEIQKQYNILVIEYNKLKENK